MSIPIRPECSKRECKHWLGFRSTLAEGQTEENAKLYGPDGPMFPVCDAFPDGIPRDIAYGHNPHTSPVDGDHGIKFEPMADSPTQAPLLAHPSPTPNVAPHRALS